MPPILSALKRKVINLFHYIFIVFYNIYISLFYKSSDIIYVNAWIKFRWGRLVHRNLGDELNVYIIEALTNKKVLPLTYALFKPKNNYCVIGSVIEWISTNDTIVWGSGVMHGYDNSPMSKVPKKILAVRGHLSREYLLKNNVECPEVYGDPALLLPLIYQPKVSCKKKIGLIAHIKDNNDVLRQFCNDNRDSVLLISLSGYDDWHTVIDKINSCEIILSSSLHGLIISDAYKVPNVWLKMASEKSLEIAGGTFKYFDYFSSVGRTDKEPFEITDGTTLEDVLKLKSLYREISFDYSPLINNCPFDINVPSL